MTEYWKSQEKTYCDICKCWLTDNKSSVDFHKNGKRHKENVEKRLQDILRKNKAADKKDKKLEHEMKRIERAAAAACEKDVEYADISMQVKMAQNLQAEKEGRSTDPDADAESPEQPKILHRKEKKKPDDDKNVAASSSSSSSKPSSTATATVGAWQPVTQPTYVDYELPGTAGHSFEYEARPREKRKAIQFTEKTVDSIKPSVPSVSQNSWMKVEPTVEFKKRKFSKNNMRQRDDD